MQGRILTWKLITGILLVLLPIWVLTVFGYTLIHQAYKVQLTDSITALLTTTQQGLNSWKEEHFHNLELVSANPQLVKITEQLLTAPRRHDNLIGHPAQAQLRQNMQPLMNSHAYRGYFIIAPDGTNLASSRDANIGEQSLLQLQHKKLQQGWRGEFFISAPQPSDVPLKAPSGALIANYPTMFVGAPVRNAANQVIAILALRLDPTEHFSKILHQGRIGSSGETYAISHTGQLLSEIRFRDFLGQRSRSAFQVHTYAPELLQQLSKYHAATNRNGKGDAPSPIELNLEPYADYRGVPVVGAWLWEPSFDLGLITEIDETQAYGSLYQVRRVLLANLLLISLLVAILGVGFQWIQQRARRKQREFKRLFENAGDALIIADPYSQKLLACNGRACQTLGYSREDMGQLSLKNIKEETFPGELENHLQEVIEQGNAVFEAYYIHHNGSRFPAEVSCQVIEYRNQSALLLSLRDISRHKALESQLKAQAQTDLLTQLPNRLAFDEQIPVQMKNQKLRNEQLALLFIGLDEFSIINDTLGHVIGDQVLMKVAQRISETLPAGAFLYRFEGDVFVCSMRVDKDNGSDLAAGNLARAFTQPLSVHGRLLHLTVSIGAACYPKDAEKLVDLTRCAHSAMHAAKDLGGSRWVFYTDEMRANYQFHLEIKNTIGHALKQGQFSLNYQPIVDAQTGLIVGAESLIRWNHPELGMVRPDLFIPIAESSGHIIEIGAWVIDEACSTLAQLRALGFTELRLSVNLSPVQLLAADIIGTVNAAINRYGLPASALAIEITEGLFIEDTGAALTTLRSLHQQEIALYMDDFGTGYSSLSYLTRFPFHTLKLDRSFVTHLEERTKDRHLASSIIAMSEKLGLRVIAEGVETPWQKSFLEENGCHLFQGYLFYKPMDKEELLECLQAEKQKPTPCSKLHSNNIIQVSK